MKTKDDANRMSIWQKTALIFFLVRKSSRFSPAYIPLRILHTLFQACTPFVVSLLPALIIDALIAHEDLNWVLTLAALAVLAGFMVGFFGYILQRVLDKYAFMIDQNIEKSMDEAFIDMPYEKLEDPKIKDMSETARNVTNHASSLSSMVTMFLSFLGQAVSLIGMVSILSRLVLTDTVRVDATGMVGWLARNGGSCLLFVLVLSVLSACSNMLLTKTYAKFQEKFAPVGRSYRYYGGLVRQEVYAKDIRVFGLYALIRERIGAYRDEDQRLQLDLNRYEIGIGVLGDVLMAAQISVVYAMVACKALAGSITIGEFYLYVSAVTQVIAIVKSMISVQNSINRCLIYQKAYREILEQVDTGMDRERQHVKNSNMQQICFDHVTFTYPGSGSPILNDVSFTMKKGERLALVGRNGAGKTTIIKLMLGLYTPESGRVLWNGQDIRDLPLREYIRSFGVVFQDYKLIAASLKDNVSMQPAADAVKVGTYLDQAGLTALSASLSEGMDTQLLPRFDAEGVNLSGGESQKVAIARALYREPSVLIMDEPTSALDPISERDIFHLIQEKTIGKTAVFISHRLSSCRLCDRILVISEGKIAQEGSHEYLVAREGLYQAMWNAQARFYV